jgi:hypothetical protein
MSYLREMLGEGFFKKPRAITDVKIELENRGHHIPLTSLRAAAGSPVRRA